MDEIVDADVISIKFKVNHTIAGCDNFLVRLVDSRLTGGWDINFTPLGISPGGGVSGTYASDAEYNIWREFELILDRTAGELVDGVPTGQLMLFEGGRQLRAPQPFHPTHYKGSLGGIAIGTPRTTNTVGIAKFYVDDILIRSLSDDYIVDKAAEIIKNFGDVTENLPLYTKIYGADVEWSSDNPDVIANDGTVTRPVGKFPQAVTLTANISRGTESTVKTVTANVLPIKEYEIVNVTVEEGLISDVTVKKNTVSANAMLMIAVYDDEKLSSIDMYNMGSAPTETIPLTINIGQGNTFKVFIWDIINLKPLAVPYEG